VVQANGLRVCCPASTAERTGIRRFAPLRNRDAVDGRPRGCLRAFGPSRIGLRRQAHAGFLPGVRKSSW